MLFVIPSDIETNAAQRGRKAAGMAGRKQTVFRGKGATSLATALAAFAAERQGARVLIDGATRKNYIALRNAVKRNSLPYSVESNALGVWLVPKSETAPLVKISETGAADYHATMTASERREVIAERLAAEWTGMLRGTRRIYRAPSKKHIATRGKAWHMRQYGKALAAYRAAGDETNAARIADTLAAFDRLSVTLIGRVWEDIGALDSCLLETPRYTVYGAPSAADSKAFLAYFWHEYERKETPRATFDYSGFIMRASKAQHETRQCNWTLEDLRTRRGITSTVSSVYARETPESEKAKWIHPADHKRAPNSWQIVPRKMRVRALLAAVYDARQTLIVERDRMSVHVATYGAPLTPDGIKRVCGPFQRAQGAFKACLAAYNAARLETV
jgi:hypothetical protein